MKLRVKIKDAIRSDRFLPVIAIFGIAIAVYRGADVEGILLYGVPGLLLVWLIALMIEINTTYLVLSEDGLTFTASNLQKEKIRWDTAIKIEDKKKGKYRCKKLTVTETGKYAFIPSIIFTYPEVSRFLGKNSPKGHGLLACLKSNNP